MIDSTLLRLSYFFLLLIAFPEASQAVLIDRSLVIVNNEVLTLSELRQFKKDLRLRKELDPFMLLLGQNPKGTKARVQYLLQERLVAQKFPTSDEEVEKEITKIRKKISMKNLNSLLKSHGTNYKSYKKIMKISLSKRKLIDRELRTLASISPEQVRSHYYTSPKYARYRKKKKQLLHYKLSQLQIPQKELIKSIQVQLERGVSFNSIADQYKQEGVSLINLDMLREDEFTKKVRDSLRNKKKGSYTNAILLRPGLFAIHRVDEVGNPHDPVFERFRKQIKENLLKKSIQHQLVAWTERQKAKSFVLIP